MLQSLENIRRDQIANSRKAWLKTGGKGNGEGDVKEQHIRPDYW